jgi:hypothetical protein
MNPEEIEDKLAKLAAKYKRDPLGFVRKFYPWQELGSSGPRPWQGDVLDAIGKHLRDPKTRFEPCQIAVASGHGIGKSALVGQIINWAKSTCVDCRIITTANTKDQLSTKTVPEVGKWFRMSLNAHWFNVQATSIKAKDPKHTETWRTDFLTWSDNNTEAFAGLHNKGKRIVLIFDEASAIADKVWEVAEGAMTDEDTEIIWLVFGNPTQNTGRFRECFGKFKHRWKTLQVDSREVDGTNKAKIAKWIEDYGEDSDFVRVRVRGVFPRAGSSQFIPSDIVEACRKYKAESYAHLPKVMAVDVARFGDDQSVIAARQGRHFRILAKFRGLDTVQLAEKVIEAIGEEKPDAIVVDGDGIGAGVVDTLSHRGFRNKVVEFHGGGTANDAAAYYNRRAEIWGLMRDSLKAGLELPNDQELADDLTGPEYGFSNKSQIQLEKKDDMKARGLASPDCGDTLAMTFAVTVAPKIPAAKTHSSYYGEQSWMA